MLRWRSRLAVHTAPVYIVNLLSVRLNSSSETDKPVLLLDVHGQTQSQTENRESHGKVTDASNITETN